jgi:hypothetical protein
LVPEKAKKKRKTEGLGKTTDVAVFAMIRHNTERVEIKQLRVEKAARCLVQGCRSSIPRSMSRKESSKLPHGCSVRIVRGLPLPYASHDQWNSPDYASHRVRPVNHCCMYHSKGNCDPEGKEGGALPASCLEQPVRQRGEAVASRRRAQLQPSISLPTTNARHASTGSSRPRCCSKRRPGQNQSCPLYLYFICVSRFIHKKKQS